MIGNPDIVDPDLGDASSSSGVPYGGALGRMMAALSARRARFTAPTGGDMSGATIDDKGRQTSAKAGYEPPLPVAEPEPTIEPTLVANAAFDANRGSPIPPGTPGATPQPLPTDFFDDPNHVWGAGNTANLLVSGAGNFDPNSSVYSGPNPDTYEPTSGESIQYGDEGSEPIVDTSAGGGIGASLVPGPINTNYQTQPGSLFATILKTVLGLGGSMLGGPVLGMAAGAAGGMAGRAIDRSRANHTTLAGAAAGVNPKNLGAIAGADNSGGGGLGAPQRVVGPNLGPAYPTLGGYDQQGRYIGPYGSGNKFGEGQGGPGRNIGDTHWATNAPDPSAGLELGQLQRDNPDLHLHFYNVPSGGLMPLVTGGQPTSAPLKGSGT